MERTVGWTGSIKLGGLIAGGIPGALAPAGLLEVVAGHPFTTPASPWDQLAGWQRGVLGMIVAAPALVLMVCGLVLFG